MPDLTVVAATFPDLAAADAGFATLVRLYGEEPQGPMLDAVTIGRKPSGVARFHRIAPQAALTEDVRVGLSAGVAAAVFPSVHLELRPSLLLDRAEITAVAGELVSALGRARLMELGARLDSSAASLLAAAPRTWSERVAAALESGAPVSYRVSIDSDRIGRSVRATRVSRSASADRHGDSRGSAPSPRPPAGRAR